MTCRALVIAAAAAGCWRTEPSLRATPPVALPPGTISLARIPDFDIGVTMEGRDCALPVALRALGAATVRDCGRFDLDRVQEDELPAAPLVAARACVTSALAGHQPFVLVWHDSGGDPICDDLAILNGVDTQCGIKIGTTTRALVGIRARDGYATYWIESNRGYSQDSTRSGEVAPLQTDASYDVERCSSITPVTDDSCNGIRLQDCFVCQDGEATRQCESAP